MIASKSRETKQPRKNASAGKPYPDFPLTPHASGRWRKIHKGALWFVPLDDPDGALVEDGQAAA